MWYNIFLKGSLSSVYHSNNNCNNYHFLPLFWILQDKICYKKCGSAEYVHFQTINNFSIYLRAMGFRKNYNLENWALNLGHVSFWDKYFFPKKMSELAKILHTSTKTNHISGAKILTHRPYMVWYRV